MKKILPWMFPIFCGLCAFAYIPHFSAIIFTVGCILSLPIPKINGFLESKGLSGKLKGVLLAAVLFAGIMATPSIPKNDQKDADDGKQVIYKEPEDANNIESVKSEEEEKNQQKNDLPERYMLKPGIPLTLKRSIKNDVTGNWILSSTTANVIIADHALDYYNEIFSSDEEIHAVWNANKKTTTRISKSGNLLYVDTYEYVSGEENDAKLLFSGELLDSRIIDVETGELYQEPEPEESKPEQPEPETTPESDSEPRHDPDQEPVVEPEQISESEPEKTINGRSSNSIVYVSNRSNTIHSVNDCGGMKNYREMTIGEADGRGYKYCPNCW